MAGTLMTLRQKGSQLWLWTVVWTGLGFMITSWMVCRRIGFSTDYARIKHLTSAGEFRQLLEPGAIPDNGWLPPHLRLDKRSMLDNDTTRIAEPPVIDMMLKDTDIALNIPLPMNERTEVKLVNPWFKNTFVVLPAVQEQRFIKKRLGLTEEEKARVPIDEFTQSL